MCSATEFGPMDDEEFAFRLQALELAQGDTYNGFLVEQQSNEMPSGRKSDLEHAAMLQMESDWEAARFESEIVGKTDLEVAKMLQNDEDEAEMLASAAENKRSDLELARALQTQEDVTANDFLIAQELQMELEAEEKMQRQESHPAARGHNNGERRSNSRQRRHHRHRRSSSDESDDDFMPGGDTYEELLLLDDDVDESANQGLVNEEVASLPTSRYKSASRSSSKNDTSSCDSNCRICLTDFAENESLRTLPCLHRFHCECIDEWLKRKGECPVCRVAIRDQFAP